MNMSDNLSPTDPFPPHVKEAVLSHITTTGYVHRERLTYAKYIRIQVFLDDPTLKPTSQVDSKTKHDALKLFELSANKVCTDLLVEST
jgi:hypothetical protein